MAKAKRHPTTKLIRRQRYRQRRKASQHGLPLLEYDYHEVSLPDGSRRSLPLPRDCDLPPCQPLIPCSFDDVHYYESGSVTFLRQRHSFTLPHSGHFTPFEHSRQALRDGSSLFSSSSLPTTLSSAIDFLCSSGQGIVELRQLQRSRIINLSNALNPIKKYWISQMPRQIRSFCSHLHLPLMAVLLRRANYADWEFPLHAVFGLPVTGSFSLPGRVFASEPSTKWSYVDPSSLLHTGPLHTHPTLQKLQRTPLTDHDAILWQSALAEVTSHTMDGPIHPDTFCSNFHISRRFAVIQPSKVRPCDDFTASGLNDAQCFDGRVTLPTVDLISLMYHELAKRWPGSFNLRIWIADHQAAYRQVPSFPPHTYTTFVGVKNPADNTVYLFRHYAQAFGSRSSVWNYCRLSQCMVFLSRSYFSSILVSYIDDFSGGEDESTALSSYDSFIFLNSCLGWSIKESKCVKPTQSLTLLGVRFRCSGSSLHLSIPPDKLSSLIDSLRSIISRESLSSGDGLKLCGKLGFATSTYAYRAGRPFIRILFNHISSARKSKNLTLSPTTTNSCQALLSLFTNSLNGRLIDLATVRDHSVNAILYSDADGSSRVGGCYVTSSDRLIYFSEFIPTQLLEHVISSPPSIVYQECCAALLTISTFAHLLHDQSVILFVDATAVEYMLLRGSSKSPDLNRLVMATWLIAASSRISLWIGGVRSAQNLADAPSRRQYNLLHGWERFRITLPPRSTLSFNQTPYSSHSPC